MGFSAVMRKSICLCIFEGRDFVMLRSKGLTEKLIVLGIDGMDPRFSKAGQNGCYPKFYKQ